MLLDWEMTMWPTVHWSTRVLTLLTLQPGRASPAQPRVKSNFPCWPQSAVRLGGGGDVASWLFRRQQRPGCGQVTRVLWGFAFHNLIILSEVKNYFYKLLSSPEVESLVHKDLHG